jgi:hypothetical protein
MRHGTCLVSPRFQGSDVLSHTACLSQDMIELVNPISTSPPLLAPLMAASWALYTRSCLTDIIN